MAADEENPEPTAVAKPTGSLRNLLTPLIVGLVLGGSSLLIWNWQHPPPVLEAPKPRQYPLRLSTDPIPNRILKLRTIIRGGDTALPRSVDARREASDRHPLLKLAVVSLELPTLCDELRPYLAARHLIVLEHCARITTRWFGRMTDDPAVFTHELESKLALINRFAYDLDSRDLAPVPEDFKTALGSMGWLVGDPDKYPADFPNRSRVRRTLNELIWIEQQLEAEAPHLPLADIDNPAQSARAMLNLIDELLHEVQLDWHYRIEPLDLPVVPNLHDAIGRRATRQTIRIDPLEPPPRESVDEFAAAWRAMGAEHDELMIFENDPTYRAAIEARRRREESRNARKTADDLRRIRGWARRD